MNQHAAHRAFTLQVPATTANLGAGYDLLGVALQYYNRLHFRPSNHYAMTLSGPYGQSRFQLDAKSLIWKGVERVYQAAQRPMPCFEVEQHIAIPPARGLGSSSSAIVAGVYAANLWLEEPFTQEELLVFATEIEGHPDNVAPALLGGAILNFPGQTQRFTRLAVPTALHWGVCIPDFTLKTHVARQAIPAQISLEDAIANLSYLSSLIVGFQTQQPALIAQGLQDRLHQPYRQALVPGMAQVMEAARSAGALGCVLSGAGPSLLVLGTEPLEHVGKEMCQIWKKHQIEAQFVTCLIDLNGVVCLD